MTNGTEAVLGVTREELLKSATVLDIESVEIDAGKVVYIKQMTGTERDAFEASVVIMRGRKTEMNFANARSKLLVRCLCDSAGKRMFAENETSIVGSMNAALVDKLFAVAQRMNGLADNDVKELTSGLDDAQSGDSTSD